MSEKFDFLIEQLKEAKVALIESMAAADRLELDEIVVELREALGYVNGALEDIVPKGVSRS